MTRSRTKGNAKPVGASKARISDNTTPALTGAYTVMRIPIPTKLRITI